MLDKNAICQNYLNQAMRQKNQLYTLINTIKNQHLNQLNNALNNMKDKPLSEIDDLMNEANNINNSMDDIVDNLDYADDARSIAECLGILVHDPDTPSPQDPPNPGQMLRSALNSKQNDLMSLFDVMLDPFEKMIGSAMSALENAIPQDLIDSLLNLIQCLADCPGADGLPTQVEIETKLDEAGLTIHNDVNFDSDAIVGELPEPVSVDEREHYRNIKNMTSDVKNKSKDILTKSPF